MSSRSNDRNEGETKEGAMSPVMSAQERKRQILERRRGKRPASTMRRSNSVVEQTESPKQRKTLRRSCSVPLSCFSSPPRPIPKLSSPDTLFSKSRLSRRSPISSSSRSLVFAEETATLHGSDSSHCSIPKKSSLPSSSLFGAVMQRTTSSEVDKRNNEASVEASKTIQLDSSSTPKKSSRHVMWNVVTTPAQDKTIRRKLNSYASPGGFGLLQVLDSVTSPFRNGVDSQATPSPEQDRFEEWHEATMKHGGLGILDWCIKRRIRLECNPCLPSALTGSRGGAAGGALQRFMGMSAVSNAAKTVDDCLCQWEAGLYYWQHPAGQPPVCNVDHKKENMLSFQQKIPEEKPVKERMVNEKDIKSKSFGTTLSSNVRHASWYPKMLNLSNPLNVNTTAVDYDEAMEHRRREWQQAFRSLYFSWLGRVGALQNREEPLQQRIIGQTCFYSVAESHTVLFRCAFCSEKARMPETTGQLVPSIVLSGATMDFRDHLKSRGVDIKLLTTSNKEVSTQGPSKELQGGNKDDSDANLVKEELEALRQAQLHGVTAGADISIKAKRGSTLDRQNRQPVSICVVGSNDCNAFFEIYLNNLGSLVFGSQQVSYDADVPLLLTRKIGPFLHSSLKTLSVTSRREAATNLNDEKEEHALIDLTGPILPCALDELVSATTTRMVIDKQKVKETKADKQNLLNTGGVVQNALENVDIGSHYFVIHAQTLEGRSDKYLGGPALLNGAKRAFGTQAHPASHEASHEANMEFQECHQGEVVSMAVWDIARPDKIAYKVDPAVHPNK